MDTVLLSRRRVLRFTGVAAFAPLLARCGTVTVTTVTADIVADLSGLVKTAQIAEPVLAAMNPPVLSAATLAEVESGTAEFESILSGVSPATPATSALSVVQQAMTVFNGLVSAAGALAPPPYGTFLQIAAVLLPLAENGIEALVGATASGTKLMLVKPTAMTPDEARAAMTQIIAGGK
jgi:hypothetical protein